jgi:hypothetical protein
MNDERRKATDTFERATRQLDIIEQLITLLMDGIDFSELKMSDRLNIAIKLMAEHARMLKLREDISEEDEPADDPSFFDEVRQGLRGEGSEQNFIKPFSSQNGIVSSERSIDLVALDIDAKPFFREDF